jgi:predicted nucleotidyltransferase
MVQIFELLSKKSISKVLFYFLANPSDEYYASQLQKKLKLAKNSILDALEALEKNKILNIREIGRIKQYRLNSDKPIVKQLKILQNIDKLRPTMKKLRDHELEVYLYGSCARGENKEKSDFDILILGNKHENIAGIISNERINPLQLTFLEYSNLVRKDKPFYERIEKDKIRLI